MLWALALAIYPHLKNRYPGSRVPAPPNRTLRRVELTQENQPSGLNLLATPELTRHPQPTYKTLRDNSPVMRIDGIGVLVSTWELVDEVLHDP